eukprot:scaffold10501_cov141-Amphora_coffeaeformis.AAC.12
MPTHKPVHRKPDATLQKAIAGYTKDPSTIDVFSAKDKVYQKHVNEALHQNLRPSVVKNDDQVAETLLNVSLVQDQDYVSRSFGPKSRIVAHPKLNKPVKSDPALEKALKSYTKDPHKIDVFTAEDKAYTEHVNFGLSHHQPPSVLHPEQAPTATPKVPILLNVSSREDQDFVRRSFGSH